MKGNLKELEQLLQTMDSFREKNSEKFKLLVDTGVRVKRLVSKEDLNGKKLDETKFEVQIEDDAFQSYRQLNLNAVQNEDDILKLVHFSETMSQYFDEVMVNSPQELLKNNRLAFMAKLNTLFSEIADFEAFQV